MKERSLSPEIFSYVVKTYNHRFNVISKINQIIDELKSKKVQVSNL